MGPWLLSTIINDVGPFLKQANYIVKIMKAHILVFYLITLFYFTPPGHPPTAPTRPLPLVDCCVSVFLLFLVCTQWSWETNYVQYAGLANGPGVDELVCAVFQWLFAVCAAVSLQMLYRIP